MCSHGVGVLDPYIKWLNSRPPSEPWDGVGERKKNNECGLLTKHGTLCSLYDPRDEVIHWNSSVDRCRSSYSTCAHAYCLSRFSSCELIGEIGKRRSQTTNSPKGPSPNVSCKMPKHQGSYSRVIKIGFFIIVHLVRRKPEEQRKAKWFNRWPTCKQYEEKFMRWNTC